MKTITLYHALRPTFVCLSLDELPPLRENYIEVATFTFDDCRECNSICEEVFNLTQNQEVAWRKETRSTCVGDLMLFSSSNSFYTTLFCVDGSGMKELPLSQFINQLDAITTNNPDLCETLANGTQKHWLMYQLCLLYRDGVLRDMVNNILTGVEKLKRGIQYLGPVPEKTPAYKSGVVCTHGDVTRVESIQLTNLIKRLTGTEQISNFWILSKQDKYCLSRKGDLPSYDFITFEQVELFLIQYYTKSVNKSLV